MPRIVVYDEGATPQKVLQVTGPSENQGFWDDSGRTDYLVNPDLSALSAVPQKYWKVEGGAVVEMTTAEKTAQDLTEAVTLDLSNRTGAKDQIALQNRNGLILRALADIIKDEINILRAFHALPPRTLAQLRNAIDNRIDSGDVDV